MPLPIKIGSPHLPTPLAQLSGKKLSDSPLRSFHLRGEDLNSIRIRNLDLSGGLIEGVSFDGAKLSKMLVNDVVFKHVSLATTDCSESSFIRVEISDGRMTGWDTNMSTLEDLVISRCKLDMANFRSTNLKRVRFSDCILTEADFLGATLEEVDFQDCLLEKTQFSQCKMRDVDLRASQLIDIAGWGYLKGAMINSVQLAAVAPYLAHELGIKVND